MNDIKPVPLSQRLRNAVKLCAEIDEGEFNTIRKLILLLLPFIEAKESALAQAREEGRREGMREAEKYICEAIVATQDGCDGTMRCDVADLLRLFNERKAIARASEGK